VQPGYSLELALPSPAAHGHIWPSQVGCLRHLAHRSPMLSPGFGFKPNSNQFAKIRPAHTLDSIVVVFTQGNAATLIRLREVLTLPTAKGGSRQDSARFECLHIVGSHVGLSPSSPVALMR
jgi:hypothetical protein